MRSTQKVRALVAAPSAELESFVSAVRQSGVAVEKLENQGMVVLETEGGAHAELVLRLYAAWQRGERDWLAKLPKQEPEESFSWRELARCSGVLLIALMAIVLYPLLGELGRGEVNALAMSLLIVDVSQGFEVSLSRLAHDQDFWRWLTPAFVHFSWVHVLFNCAALFEFGRRIEISSGTGVLIMLIILIAVLANLVQVAFGVSPLFGGLSGVVYGLVGYVMVRRWLDPLNPHWQMHPAVAGSMLLFLVLFSTGATGVDGVDIAHAAHWGGLIAGALLGLMGGVRRTIPR